MWAAFPAVGFYYLGAEGFGALSWVLAVLFTLATCGCCGYLMYKNMDDDMDDEQDADEEEEIVDEETGQKKVVKKKKKTHKKNASETSDDVVVQEDPAPPATDAEEAIKGETASELHDFQPVSFAKPTWCAVCNAFLWGFGQQGSRCSACSEARCFSCAKCGGGHCSGAIASVTEIVIQVEEGEISNPTQIAESHGAAPQCSTPGCTRATWNGEPGQSCCRTCSVNDGRHHGPECDKKNTTDKPMDATGEP